MILWLLSNWRLVLAAAALSTLTAMATVYRLERNHARAQYATAIATINLMTEAGKSQAAATERANLASLDVTRRANDALVSQLDNARKRATIDAARLRVVASQGGGCTLSDVTVTANRLDESPRVADSEASAAIPFDDYAQACEADSARLSGWQEWWRKQNVIRP